LSSHRSDGGLTMHIFCSKDNTSMRAGAQGHSPEVVGRHLNIIRIYAQ